MTAVQGATHRPIATDGDLRSCLACGALRVPPFERCLVCGHAHGTPRDELRAARGISLGLAIAVPLWLALLAAVWLLSSIVHNAIHGLR